MHICIIQGLTVLEKVKTRRNRRRGFNPIAPLSPYHILHSNIELVLDVSRRPVARVIYSVFKRTS